MRTIFAVTITLAVLAGFGSGASAHETDFLRRWIAIYGKVLPPKDQALLIGMVAHEMGSNDTCPPYKVFWPALRKELDGAGFVPNEQSVKYSMVLVEDMIKHDDDRSRLCREAWELFGPNGSYRRQMLEAN